MPLPAGLDPLEIQRDMIDERSQGGLENVDFAAPLNAGIDAGMKTAGMVEDIEITRQATAFQKLLEWRYWLIYFQ